MGNPVWNVGFEAGKKFMSKIAVSIGIGGVLGAGTAYFLGKAKGKAEALNEIERDTSELIKTYRGWDIYKLSNGVFVASKCDKTIDSVDFEGIQEMIDNTINETDNAE